MSQPEQIPADYRGGFLKALLTDASANTLAIGAASMVPLLAMVGGAVDASRFYMAETRLQAACDAGALAARRAMDDLAFSAEHRRIGERFFKQNFEDGMFGVTDQNTVYAGTADGEVQGTASAVMPTSLMGMFGYEEFNLSVDCTADINISNTDIMFVLDVTGSMACNPSGGSCNSGSTSKIQGLREAVMTFYETVADATSPRAQVRYGAVPYSYNVNVGAELVAADPSWMAEDAVFQSRWAKFEEKQEWVEIGQQITDIDNRRSEDDIGFELQSETTASSRSACAALEPAAFTDEVQTNLGLHQGQNGTRTEGNFRYTEYDDDNETLWRGEPRSIYNDGGRCRVGWDIYEYRADVTFEVVEELQNMGIQFDEWIYDRVDTANPPGASNPPGSPPGWESIDLTTLYDATPTVDLPIGSNGAMQSYTWDGCIEEAQTVAASSFDPIPVGALDMNINLVPDSQASRWKPMLSRAVWRRRNNSGSTRSPVPSSVRSSQSRPSYRCPTPAFRLEELSRTDMQNYVNSLSAGGNTYHDIGMLWGARFITPRGIFAADNVAAPNGESIARHIVFMTDGALVPRNNIYSTYGIEWYDRYVTGNGSNSRQYSRHAERFQAACRLARQENISVWVVAFGTTLTQNLIDCATPGRAFSASDSAELEEQFTKIAQKIAALRLTQ
ncbi:MAG: pilus assembly protein TadG-related protein [Erythrobacter sp.]|uniref:pilus assembly protein TadG-related protein n=1 Tax=Erythrobacter sp. TaxID=1042 RepID=UPI00262ED8F5|nr:pilus assembly protein TadG-related protein [Erythrobacter sp.]MDJ0977769.1 pilus assembly protein TadG-related protein [Erythrobacter sp.]